MDDWEVFAWIKRSRQRQRVIRLLRDPKTPTDVAQSLDIHIAQASRSMRQMEEKGVVQVLNPEDKLGRLYVVTDEGEEILEKLDSSSNGD